MTKLFISKATESKAIATIWNMAGESLSPDRYDDLKTALKQLCENRGIDNKELSIEHFMLSGHRDHYSDCSLNNAPAYIPEPCDCKVKCLDCGLYISYSTAPNHDCLNS